MLLLPPGAAATGGRGPRPSLGPASGGSGSSPSLRCGWHRAWLSADCPRQQRARRVSRRFWSVLSRSVSARRSRRVRSLPPRFHWGQALGHPPARAEGPPFPLGASSGLQRHLADGPPFPRGGRAAVVLGLLEEVVWGGPGSSFLKVLVAAELGLQVKGSGAQELEVAWPRMRKFYQTIMGEIKKVKPRQSRPGASW